MNHVNLRTLVWAVIALAFHWAGCQAAAPGTEFSYKGSHGPSHWPGVCQSGQFQSPIDIPKGGNKSVKFEPFHMENYDRTPNSVRLVYKPNTVQVELDIDEDKVPQISGGGFNDTFKFAQLHFHWADIDREGSEHLVNKVAYPLEMHMVHYNAKYGHELLDAIANGRGASDTLAVLGFFFKLTNKDNDKLEPIIQGLAKVHESRSEVQVDLFPLVDVMSQDLAHFYRYGGSLTTPGCNEVVVWTVFEDPIDISERQLRQFREISDVHTRMQNNFRPPQPLHQREILYVDTSESSAPSSAHYSFSIVISTLALAGLLALN